MKRHQVMDLFYGHLNESVDGPWNVIEFSLPNTNHCKVLVKLSDGTEKFAYYYADRAQWIESVGYQSSYFWDCRTKEPLLNVVAWKLLKTD